MPEKRTFHFDVTQGCIDKARPGKCPYCPVELAMLAAGLTDPVAGLGFLRGRFNGAQYRARTPEEVRCFMRAFDTGWVVRALVIDLEMATQ